MSTSNAPVDGSSSAAASASTSSPAPPFHRVTLPSGHEYRFELDLVTAASGKDGDAPVAATAAGAGSVAVRALQPGARIMGEPLPVGAWYPLMLGARSCVVSASTRGEEITLEWTREPTAGAYVSSASTWPGVRNVHLALEAERIRARRRRAGSTKNGAGGGAAGGPRVLVLGSPSSGKSTTVKTLLNLALGGGMGWGLGVVGLDPGEVSCRRAGPGVVGGMGSGSGPGKAPDAGADRKEVATARRNETSRCSLARGQPTIEINFVPHGLQGLLFFGGPRRRRAVLARHTGWQLW